MTKKEINNKVGAEITRRFDILRTIFIDGSTTMACVWLMFLFGFVAGVLIFK